MELNFRDEKTILGVGEANVRTPAAVKSVPSFIVASYAFMLLAANAIKATPAWLPSPKWYPHKSLDRLSTQKILALFRSQFWGLNINLNKSGFVSNLADMRSRFFLPKSPDAAICYSNK